MGEKLLLEPRHTPKNNLNMFQFYFPHMLPFSSSNFQCYVSVNRIVEFFNLTEITGLPGSNKKNIEYYTKFKDDTLVITNASFQVEASLF